MLVDYLSVGIPTCNGAEMLQNTILSLDKALSRCTLKKIEVLICANGCTDNTAEIAKAISNQLKHLNVKVFEISGKGKATAMKYINEKALFDTLLFVDDDVKLHPDAVKNAIWKLSSTNSLVAVTAVIEPSPDKPNFLRGRFWYELTTLQFNHPEIYYQPKAHLAGAMMLIRKPLPVIPSDIINEDQFLAFTLWPRITDSEDSIVYFRPISSYKAFKNRLLRLKAGFKQIQKLFPPQKHRELYEDLVRKADATQLAKLPAMEKLMWYILRLLRWQILTFNGFTQWQRTYEKNH